MKESDKWVPHNRAGFRLEENWLLVAPLMTKRRTIISTFYYDGDLLKHIQGELGMRIHSYLVCVLFTSVKHNR